MFNTTKIFYPFIRQVMPAIMKDVFKATVGLLVHKGRDNAAVKLKQAHPLDQEFHDLIMREINDIKTEYDGQEAGGDLNSSICFFKEGVVCIFELFNERNSVQGSSVAPQTANGMRDEKLEVSLPSLATDGDAISVAEGMEKWKLPDLDDADKREILNANEAFKSATVKAREAFENEALKSTDRIEAMVICIASTILKEVEQPKGALAECHLYLEELYSMPDVQNSFTVGRSRGHSDVQATDDQRREIISMVYNVNRVICDVTLMANAWSS